MPRSHLINRSYVATVRPPPDRRVLPSQRLHGDALSEAGHDIQIFLLGEAVSLMRKSVANAVVPVGWPPLAEVLSKLVTKKIPIYACGACSRARGVTESDLAEYGAKFGNPKIFVSLVEWADKIITE